MGPHNPSEGRRLIEGAVNRIKQEGRLCVNSITGLLNHSVEVIVLEISKSKRYLRWHRHRLIDACSKIRLSRLPLAALISPLI